MTIVGNTCERNSFNFISLFLSVRDTVVNMHASTDDEENAIELKFGDIDFQKVQCLTNDEMYYLLTKRQAAGLTNE